MAIYGTQQIIGHKNILEKPEKSTAGIAQLVEHNLAKVGVASSSLVSRSIDYSNNTNVICILDLAEWQSGYAAACKAVDAGSIPASASKHVVF